MALVGLDLFRQRFAGHQDNFLLIGGTACQLALGELGIEFRATKDLDIVLCLERVDPAFAQELWAFIRDGGYRQRETASGRREYFRFAKPSATGYPAMLELFARAPDTITIGVDQRIIPAIRTLDAAGDPLSLSAILLDEVYYGWMSAGRRVIDRLPMVRAEHLIPLKARAWIDLSARSRQGEAIDQRDIRKHRNDVLRLTAIIDPGYTAVIPTSIRTDMAAFIADIQQHPPELPALGITGASLADVVGLLKSTYGA
jgi:hypothetical protein